MYHFEIKTELSKLKRARIALEKAQEEYDRVKDEVLNHPPKSNKNKTILCKKCNKRSKVSEFKYADWYWYESPHGCMGGACWNHGGISIECPKCNEIEHISKPNSFSDLEKDIEYKTVKNLMERYGSKCEDIKIKD